MKKISIFIMLFAFLTLFTVTSTIKAVETIENTSQLCADGIDNDFNGLTDSADPSCAGIGFVLIGDGQSQTVENTSQLCSDSIDNDFNGLTDLGDPSCAGITNNNEQSGQSSSVITENTLQLCSDSEDNDFNGLTDLGDPSCASFATATSTENATTTATTTPTVVTPSTGGTSGPTFGGGSSGGSSFGGGITSGTPVSAITTGTPVSATSSEPVCDEMLTTFMRKGKVNNVFEVKKLQGLLNKYLDLKIPNTGFFGNMTHNAVKAFQLKYKDSILTPWGLTAPTGYFYKTTQRQMNLLLCSTADIPMPILN